MHGNASGPHRAGNGRTPKRELERLWEQYQRSPGNELRNRLVEAYQPLVRDVVRRVASRLPRTVDRGDLETAANVGLMAAIEAYDPRRRVRFEAYGETRIRGAVLDELRSEDWLPRPWRHRIEQQKRSLELLRAELGREPSDGEVATVMRMPLEEYEQFFGTGLPGTPGGAMPADAGGGSPGPGLDVLPDLRSDPPGEKLTRDELLRLVAQRLTQLEYRIVYLKYWEGLPMREIGELTGFSESRVCKIHAKLLERLRSRLRVHG